MELGEFSWHPPSPHEIDGSKLCLYRGGPWGQIYAWIFKPDGEPWLATVNLQPGGQVRVIPCANESDAIAAVEAWLEIYVAEKSASPDHSA